MTPNQALETLRSWRYDAPEERLHPRDLLSWAAAPVDPDADEGPRRDADPLVQLQVVELFEAAVHGDAWVLRYANGLPWRECERCEGLGFTEARRHVPDPHFGDPHVDLVESFARQDCPPCGATGSRPPEAIEPRVSACAGYAYLRAERGRRFIWHGLDYELHWTVGEDTRIDGEPPRSTLSLWYRRALEACHDNGYLLAVDLACSDSFTCRRIGERLLGKRCTRCDGTGEGYFALELSGRHGGSPDAFKISACTACEGTGSIVRWWRV